MKKLIEDIVLERLTNDEIQKKERCETYECFVKIYSNRSPKEEARFTEIVQQSFEMARTNPKRNSTQNNDKILHEGNALSK